MNIYIYVYMYLSIKKHNINFNRLKFCTNTTGIVNQLTLYKIFIINEPFFLLLFKNLQTDV